MRILTALLVLATSWTPKSEAQQNDMVARVLGEALSAANEAGEFTLRSGDNRTWAVRLAQDAIFMMVEPGAKTLDNAATVAVSTMKPGDRVLVRGTGDSAQLIMLANSVVLMSKDAIAARQAREQAEWRANSLAGNVKEVDAAQGRFTLLGSGNGQRPEWAVTLNTGATLLRYSEDSIRFADARPAVLADLRPGDQIRVLGKRNETAHTLAAEKLVFGSFRTLGGEVRKVNPESKQVTIRDVQTGKDVVLVMAANSNLRRMLVPPRGIAGGMPGPGRGAAGPGPMNLNGGQPGGIRPGGMTTPNGAPGGAGRRPDLQQLLDRLPAAAFETLTPGDAIIVSVGHSSQPQPWPIVSLVAGVDSLLRAPAAQVNQTLGNWSTELPMQ